MGKRNNDAWFAYLLAAPLPIIFCFAVAAGWKRLSSRQAAREPEAPPLFKKKIPFSEIAQRKQRHMHDVKQVLDTRLRSGTGKKGKGGKKKGVQQTPELDDDTDGPIDSSVHKQK